jgi:uncharacterized protein DUF6455
MSSLASHSTEPTLERSGRLARQFAGLRQCISDFLERGRLHAEMLDLERRGSLKAVLGDMGIPLGEMKRIVGGYPEAGRLRRAMAKRLGVDFDALDPRTRYAIGENCAICLAHRQCRRWLASASKEGDYKSFCPNAEFFDAARKPEAST